jgi:hypothetical protein
MVNKKLIAKAVAVYLLFASCKHQIPFADNQGNQVPPVVTGTCSPDSVYFTNSVLPLISSGCALSGCHDPGRHEEGLVLNSYSGIMKIVLIGDASASKLYKVITNPDPGDVMPPPPHARFSATDIALVQKWINQGARNNQCKVECDTTVFTFSGAVMPLINTFCKGCHNPASLGGGIDLSNYNTIKLVATSGKLMGSIKHAPGFVAMPQGGSQLQDCQIRQIEKWIASGVNNN